MTTLARAYGISALANRSVEEVRTDTATSRDSTHLLSSEPRELCFVLKFASGEQLSVELQGSGKEPSSSWRVFHFFRQLSSLAPDWDSYGAHPLSATAVKRSVNLFPLLLPPESPAPTVVPTRDGGLQFEWHQGGIDIEIRVPSSGPVSYYVANADSEQEGEGETERNAIREALRSLVGVV